MVGAARALFVPLSLAAGFSMVGSFLLSSTLVPILSTWLLRQHAPAVERPKRRFSFERFQQTYGRVLAPLVRHRWIVLGTYAVVAGAIILVLGRHLGTEIFPQVDAGQLQLRLRAPAGTRVRRMAFFSSAHWPTRPSPMRNRLATLLRSLYA